MGNLLRRYWVPVLFSAKLPEPACTPVRITVLGERLVTFLDTEGRPGLVNERCPHRNASLFFGRNEEPWLRCVHHGWSFDVGDQCLDMPPKLPSRIFRKKCG